MSCIASAPNQQQKGTISMAQLLRIPVDILIPDGANKTQVNQITEMVKDHIGSVAGTTVFNQVITESKPGATWHIHDGKKGCDYCRSQYSDNKSADDPTGEN